MRYRYNKNIFYYISAFINSVHQEGITNGLYKVYHFFADKIVDYAPPPKPSCISLLKLLSPFHATANNKALSLIGNYLNTSYSLPNEYIIQYKKKGDFKDCEVVLLAHWDPDDIVDSYVLHAARHFKSLGKNVILCSAKPLAILPQERDTLDAIVCRTCPGYDFTSWKAAFEAFPSLYEAREITLTNDSIFAPVGSYAPIYSTMNSFTCDFWGLSLSHQIMPHFQSFFLVFRKNTLQHPAFKQFITAINKSSDPKIAIGYEVRFSLWLNLHGLQAACYRPYFLHLKHPTSMHLKWKKLLNDSIPLLKRSIAKQEYKSGNLTTLQNYIENYGYPTGLISAYFHRVEHPKNV